MSVSPVLVASLNFRKELLSTFDPSKPHKAFATPRSWEKVAHYLADQTMPAFVRDAAFSGAVGDGPAAELVGFMEVWADMIPIADIIKDPTGAPVPEETAMSMRYALSVAISGAIDKKTAAPLYTYLKRLPPEFSVLAWVMAVRREPTLVSTKACMDFLKDNHGVFLDV